MSAYPIHAGAVQAAKPAEVIGATGLGKTIDDRQILQGIDLQIASGGFVALLGANGAGKSTLLKVLATLITPSTGELRLFGRPVQTDSAATRARIGLISHQSMLYRDLSARENLVFFGRLYGVTDARSRVERLLSDVDLLHRADDPVKTLSRGMTQRVAIARALVHEPQLLLADEPFDGLDAPSAQVLERLLSDRHANGMTVILANHDISQSLRLAQRAVVLRQGQIVIDSAATQLSTPQVIEEMERA